MKYLVSGRVRIFTIQQTNPSDTRGETWQWIQHQAAQVVICKRRAGSVSCHFHSGKDPSKNPEQLFVATGKIKFTFLNPRTDEKKELIAKAGTALSIDPRIIHRTEVLEDAIILESRSTIFDPANPDTFSAEV